MPRFVSIASVDDPAIAPYRALRDRDIAGHDDAFMAEGEVVLRHLCASGRFATQSCLIAEARLPKVADALAQLGEDTPVYVAPQMVMDAIVGFPIHRGLLALGRRPIHEPLAAFLATLPAQAMVAVAVGIANHDNIGGIFRNAAAFGAAAVLLDASSCDPLYRKALRVSVGGVLKVPFHHGASAEEIEAGLAGAGFAQIGLTPAAAPELSELAPAPRMALYLGAEGPGLPQALLDRLQGVRIPMAAGFDSLNVATASGIALYHVARLLQRNRLDGSSQEGQ